MGEVARQHRYTVSYRMKVLGLCSYPVEAAATRFRLTQFIQPLAKQGIELTVSPFLDGPAFAGHYSGGGIIGKAAALAAPTLRRLSLGLDAKQFDLLLVQREAMFFGPAIFEALYRRLGNLPMVLDLDDATYISYESPTYGKIGSFFKFFGKTDKLILKSRLVTCGNRFIAEHVREKGVEAVVIPTIVDTEIFRPSERANDPLVIGWIGTHSTFPLLESIFPVLQKLAARHDFVLRIVGAKREKIGLDGVNVENLEWTLDGEVSHFQSLDIGLYPIQTSSSAPEEWLLGKSGFKAIQYLAVGVPFVMSPVGVCAEIGESGVTHFNAVTPEDWYASLDRLLTDGELRNEMGAAARRHSVEHYSLEEHASALAATLLKVHKARA